MDPEERRKLIDIAKQELWQILQASLAERKAQDREWRRRQPGQDSVSRGIGKAERRVERGLLAIMEKEIKAQRGAKTWVSRELKRRAAEYKRLKAGLGLTGVATGKRKPPPPNPFRGLKIADRRPGGVS